MARGTHSTDSTSSLRWESIRVNQVGTAVAALLREHHQPFVVLLGIVVFVAPSIFPGDISVLDSSKINATICINNDKIANLDVESTTFLDVVDIRAAALEVDYMEWLLHLRHVGETVGTGWTERSDVLVGRTSRIVAHGEIRGCKEF